MVSRQRWLFERKPHSAKQIDEALTGAYSMTGQPSFLTIALYGHIHF